MAKKDKDENLVDLGQVYSKSEDFVNKNGKLLSGIIIGLLVLVIGYFLYNNVYLEGVNKEANEEIWKSEYYLAMDSLDLALEGDSLYLGFEEISDEYGRTRSGNLADYYCGLIYRDQGDYELALEKFENCSFPEGIVESQRLGNIGDMHIELGNIEAGIDYFQQSVDINNEATSPIYLKKMGLAYQELGDNEAAIEAYKKIKTDFNTSAEGRSIDKYIAMLEAAN